MRSTIKSTFSNVLFAQLRANKDKCMIKILLFLGTNPISLTQTFSVYLFVLGLFNGGKDKIKKNLGPVKSLKVTQALQAKTLIHEII